MMSRITIKLQRSPSISRVKLIGQPERISLVPLASFTPLLSTTCILQGVGGIVRPLAGCNQIVGSRRMKKIIGGSLVFVAVLGAVGQIHAQDAKTPYPTMAPIEQYRMDRDAEIAMARTAAPASISRDASVMVLGQKNYETEVEGTNGFVC